jgi:prepilin-type N-terminal cleavage/methylation domain-containing protein
MWNKKGFTLVELLVVIAIIALLLGILMPSLAKVRAQATIVLCATTQHSWGTALAVYAADNSNYFPYNGVATPTVPLGTYSLNWCGSVVQEFWRMSLFKNDSVL